jgi:hypothetical protein
MTPPTPEQVAERIVREWTDDYLEMGFDPNYGFSKSALDMIAAIAQALSAASGENRVMRKMLGDFYARAKDIEDRIRLPVDGPPPITLVRHVISQYETVIKQALDAGKVAT